MALLVVENVKGHNVFVAYSVAGGGPVWTVWGILEVSAPYTTLHMKVDPFGTASRILAVPGGASGEDIWFQALDFGSQSLTNGLALTVQ